MSYSGGYRISIGPALTPVVKYLIITCVLVFLLQSVSPGRDEMTFFFGLTPILVLQQIWIWQLATYLFLHGNFWHIFFNVWLLWMFGCELERHWGSREFLKFFFVTGIGAGILSVLVNPFSQVPTIGASGAIYGILMAFWVLFPERLIYLYFLFPVKVKYLVAVLGLIAFFSALNSPGSPIAHVAHLGGMAFAFLYLKRLLSLGGLKQIYYRWRLKRMRGRFRVYDSEERKKENDFWIQ